MMADSTIPKELPMTCRIRFASCAGVLLLSACGGGGGGDSGPPPPSLTGGGFAPSSGPGDTDSYYPAAGGNQWQFNYTTDDPTALSSSGIVTVTVTGTKPVQGVTATVLNHANTTSASGGFDSYLGITAGGVTDLGNTDATDTLSPLLVPYVEQLFPVTPNSPVSTLTAKNLPVSDGAGHNGTLDLTQTIANADIETVDVPAGTFTNALKQTTTISGSVTANGQNTPITGSQTSWSVPGVGEVKEVDQASGGSTSTHTTADLRFYVVNGTPHGLAPPRLLNGPNGQLPTRPEPALASDGTNFLVVMLEAVAGSSPTQQSFTGAVVDPYGNATFFSISPAAVPGPSNGRSLQAAAASDGTHWLVVYETDHSSTGDPTTVDSVVLSASGAILAGPTTVGTLGEETFPSGNPGAEALAFDGSRYLLAYVSNVGTITGEYLDPATGQVDGASFPLLTTLAYTVDTPVLAFDGTNYLLAFGSASDTTIPAVRAERVSTAGVVLDATPLVVVQQSIPGGPMAFCCNFTLPAVSFDGTNYLVSYWDFDNGLNSGGAGNYANVRSARVSKSLALLDNTAIPLTSTPVVPVWGRISSAYLQGAHWVLWTQGDTGGPNTIRASRVSPAGTVPAAWTNGFAVNADNNGSQFPVITAGSGGGYISWVDAAFSSPQLMGLRLY
jgi:hypothetical protein